MRWTSSRPTHASVGSCGRDRPGRGFRFRVPGWGDLDWRELITELQLAGYGGVLSIEHEDPTMSRRDGLAQAVAHLGPLLLQDPPEPKWW